MAYTLQPMIQTLEKILHPDHHHLVLDHKRPQLETILKKATYLDEIIESSLPASSKQIESVENQIRITTEKAEDIIESDIVDQILFGSKVNHATHSATDEVNVLTKPGAQDHFISWWSFFFKDIPSPELQQVIDELDSLIEKVTRILERMPGSSINVRSNISFSGAAVISDPSLVVGLDEDVKQLLDRLTGESNKLEVIPIIGMGGIGKTTLAQILYNHPGVAYHFDVRSWATVSLEYNLEAVLSDLIIGCITVNGSGEMPSEENDESRGEKLSEGNDELRGPLYQKIIGRRYLIVLDDVWDAKFWDEIKMCFPDTENKSRILLTSRELSVANYVNLSREHHKMHLLDEVESWRLMCLTVFGKENCPSLLEEIGKDVARNCEGHPLTIQVVSGVLKESQRTENIWKNVVYGINSIVTEKGAIPGRYDIQASTIIRLWMAEGFLRSTEGKTFEDVGKEYLKALVDRNLVMVKKQKSGLSPKYFGIHDLLRNLCMTKTKQENLSTMRHIFEFPYFTREYSLLPLTRSFLCIETRKRRYYSDCLELVHAKLLRVLHYTENEFNEFPEDMLKLVNLRYLAISCSSDLPSAISRLWNLQTLIIRPKWPFYSPPVATQCELWRLKELRHVELGSNLYVSAEFNMHGSIHDKLVHLSDVDVSIFRRGDFADKIPNVEKLGIRLDLDLFSGILYLRNLVKLKKVHCFDTPSTSSFNTFIIFPDSIKKLYLTGCALSWISMAQIGLLPNLQVLNINNCLFWGNQWNPTEGEFRNLQFLKLREVELLNWNANEVHFPKLKKLAIHFCFRMQNIPQCIGDLPMEIIEVDESSASAVASALLIQEEQRDLGNYELQVRIIPQLFKELLEY